MEKGAGVKYFGHLGFELSQHKQASLEPDTALF
jgi:hypothetical protein